MLDRKALALLALATNSDFSVAECEEIAKDLDAFDTLRFDLVGPSGRLGARWLDAYYGFILIDGQEGFISAQDFKFSRDVRCENLRVEQDAAA